MAPATKRTNAAGVLPWLPAEWDVIVGGACGWVDVVVGSLLVTNVEVRGLPGARGWVESWHQSRTRDFAGGQQRAKCRSLEALLNTYARH
jgi:hypothetical protein